MRAPTPLPSPAGRRHTLSASPRCVAVSKRRGQLSLAAAKHTCRLRHCSPSARVQFLGAVPDVTVGAEYNVADHLPGPLDEWGSLPKEAQPSLLERKKKIMLELADAEEEGTIHELWTARPARRSWCQHRPQCRVLTDTGRRRPRLDLRVRDSCWLSERESGAGARVACPRGDDASRGGRHGGRRRTSGATATQGCRATSSCQSSLSRATASPSSLTWSC